MTPRPGLQRKRRGGNRSRPGKAAGNRTAATEPGAPARIAFRPERPASLPLPMERDTRRAPGPCHSEPSRATCRRPPGGGLRGAPLPTDEYRRIPKRTESPARPRPAGFIHVRGSDPPWSRTPPANFTGFETPRRGPDEEPGRPGKHRTRAPGTREQNPVLTPARDRPHFLLLAFSIPGAARGSGPRIGIP